MIFRKENKDENEILIKCSCGHGIIEFSQFKDDKDAFLTYYSNDFYSLQKPGWTSFVDNLKAIWRIITGRRYSLYEAHLYPEDIKDLKEAVNSLEE